MKDFENKESVELWCLHGALGEVSDWRQLGERTTDAGVTAYPLDLWRFLCCEPVGMDRFGHLLNALVRPSSVSAPPVRRVLLGYSLGGRLALHALLSEHGHPWDAAVIVSAHPGLEDESERAARREADAEWSALAHSGDWSEMLERWNAQPVFSAGGGMRPVADRAALVRQRREVARSFVAWSLGAQEPLWGRLPEIDIPVLWIAGGRDEKFCDIGRRAAAALPSARLSVAAGAGHRVPWEVPGAFAESVLEFLEDEG
jgi:2-succinyl-6-hydroxy-2,4-cyclohexadiene-1-carboxylate synthase